VWNALLLTVLAGLSTVMGSLIIFFMKGRKELHLNIAMGFSAGVMIFISFTELLNESIMGIGYLYAVISFFAGIALIYLIDVFIPHSYEEESPCDPNLRKKCDMKRCGTMVAIGIAIHNFPEGITVFFASLADIRLGIVIAIAIALHNIPEGIAIAMPIYYATKSKMKAFWYSFLSGIAEPIGALLAFAFLFKFINSTVLNIILAATAGIMVFISFDELLPHVYNEKESHLTILGIFVGMGVMALSLFLL
jgi:ZIP family zinc transporter